MSASNPLARAAVAVPGDDSTNVSTIRVAVSTAVTFGIVWVAERFTEYDVDTDNPLIILAGGVVFGAAYRAYRLFAARFPTLAWVPFGVGAEPKILEPPVDDVPVAEVAR